MASVQAPADVAELADALDLGSSSREGVQVQVLSSAPISCRQSRLVDCGRETVILCRSPGSGSKLEAFAAGVAFRCAHRLFECIVGVWNIARSHDVAPLVHTLDFAATDRHRARSWDPARSIVADCRAGKSWNRRPSRPGGFVAGGFRCLSPFAFETSNAFADVTTDHICTSGAVDRAQPLQAAFHLAVDRQRSRLLRLCVRARYPNLAQRVQPSSIRAREFHPSGCRDDSRSRTGDALDVTRRIAVRIFSLHESLADVLFGERGNM